MRVELERRVSALASRQRGYVTRVQLIALGATRHEIAWGIKSGRLIPAHHGVYAVGHIPALLQDRAFGALLACGAGAVLSHGSAAAVWGLYRRWGLPFEVTARGLRRHRGIAIHRGALARRDMTRQLGLPVTSPARTVLDMTPRLTEKQLRRAVNELRLARQLTPEQLADVADRFPRHPGARRLRPHAATTRGATRSGIEDKFADFCERYGFSTPLLNHRVAGREVDAFFSVERVIIEIDGRDVHSGRISFEDDRDRDAEMLALDLPTVRVTEERIDNEPEREAERLHRILALRRRSYTALT
jgi:hypothetical protein